MKSHRTYRPMTHWSSTFIRSILISLDVKGFVGSKFCQFYATALSISEKTNRHTREHDLHSRITTINRFSRSLNPGVLSRPHIGPSDRTPSDHIADYRIRSNRIIGLRSSDSLLHISNRHHITPITIHLYRTFLGPQNHHRLVPPIGLPSDLFDQRWKW